MSSEVLKGVKWIVVLAGGHSSDPRLPVTDRINLETLGRVVEVMADVAGILGIKKANMVLETLSSDTEDEARLIRELMGGDRLTLVTSAPHMPRAMALFRKQGVEPIPAPANHMVKEREEGAEALKMAQTAVYEYLGSLWAWVRRSTDYAD